MKKISRLLALLMALAMAVSLAACSNDSGDVSAPASQPADDTSASPSTDGQTYTVGIIQQMQHVALDSATQGFQDALTELLGDAVTIDSESRIMFSGEGGQCGIDGRSGSRDRRETEAGTLAGLVYRTLSRWSYRSGLCIAKVHRQSRNLLD